MEIEKIITFLHEGELLLLNSEKNLLEVVNDLLPVTVYNFDVDGEPVVPDQVYSENNPVQSSIDPDICPFCFKYFARKESCLKHVKSYHTEKDKTFVCKICNGYFKTKHALDNHTQLKHSGED